MYQLPGLFSVGINKYDVFYGWALFFLRYKMKIIKEHQRIYDVPVKIDLRIHKHPDSIMNIIPADYGAKLLYNASLFEIDERQFHLANDKDVLSQFVIDSILDALNIKGHQYIDILPPKMNNLEKIYYRSVGKIFTPYIVDPPLYYNNENLQPVKKELNLYCPEINAENFSILMNYAKQHYFGLTRP